MEYLVLASIVFIAIFVSYSRSKRSSAVFDDTSGDSPQWRMSENGNKTAVVEASRVTVFSGQYGDWKFCVADAADDDAEPYFSDWYSDEASATADALRHIQGLAPVHTTREETREIKRQAYNAQVAQDLPEIIERLIEQHAKDMAMLDRQEAKPAPKQSTLQGIHDRTTKRMRHLSNHHYSLLESPASPIAQAQLIEAISSHNKGMERLHRVMGAPGTPPTVL